MLLTRADSNSTQYWCHPHHLKSSPNSWQQIFGGVYLNWKHTTNLQNVRAWVVGYVPGVDGIALLPTQEVFKTVFMSKIIANTSTSGVLSLSVDNDRTDKYRGEYFGSPVNWNSTFVSNDVWGDLLHTISYRLLPDSYDCDDYVGTTKTFGLQVTNRFGRKSNILYVSMIISTAGFIFDSAVQVVVNNDASGAVLVGGMVRGSGASLNVSWGGDIRGTDFLIS